MSPDTSTLEAPSMQVQRLTPEERVAAIAPLISGSSERIEKERRLTPEVRKALYENNLFRLLLPRAFGGDEVDPMTFFRTTMALAICDASTAWCVSQGNGCSMTAAYVEPAVARTIWADNPEGVLAWGPGRADVTEADGGYKITGRWAFASGSRHATWLGGMTPMPGFVSDRSETRTMLFPAGSVVMEDVWDTIGLRGTGTDAYTVKDLFVPIEFSTRRDNSKDRRELGPLYLLTSSALYSIGFSGVSMGIARAMLNEFNELATSKMPLRMRTTLGANTAFQAEYATAEARLGSARAFVLSEVSEIWDEILRTGEVTIAARMRIRLATTYGIHEAKHAADIAYDLSGATAVYRSNGIERRFRDIHTVTQQMQGRKDHLQTVGGFMLGQEANLASL
jgi:alkylation response protein AidB-like acyl-CoA dehydrogenase